MPCLARTPVPGAHSCQRVVGLQRFRTARAQGVLAFTARQQAYLLATGEFTQRRLHELSHAQAALVSRLQVRARRAQAAHAVACTLQAMAAAAGAAAAQALTGLVWAQELDRATAAGGPGPGSRLGEAGACIAALASRHEEVHHVIAFQ